MADDSLDTSDYELTASGAVREKHVMNGTSLDRW
jgi:hypothetical protein